MQLSTFAQSSQPVVETPIVETPTPEAPAPIVETPENKAEVIPPVVETPTPSPETPAPSNEQAFTFNIEDEPAPTPAAQQAAEQAKYDWKKEIKAVDRKELLKEAGVNEFAIELDEYLAKGGKAADYLAARAIDYNQVSDEALIKEDLKKQYPTFNPTQIELMFNRKYQALLDLDEDKEFADLQLKADAHKIREAKIQQQLSFKIPETPILQKDEAYEQWKQQQEQQPQLMEKFKSYFENHPATKSLYESKRVAINLGEGVQPFNFTLEKPEILTRALTDGGQMLNKALSTQSGEPDVEKQQLVAMFSLNPQKFIQDIFKYGQSMGVRKELVEEGQNAQRQQAIVADMVSNQAATYRTGKYGG